jgi:hypothetical protein
MAHSFFVGDVSHVSTPPHDQCSSNCKSTLQ